MKITVVTTCYNHGLYLDQCINSVLNQTIDFHEYLIFNDGSIDNSLEIMNKYKSEKVKIIDLPKQLQVSYVLNKSIELMTGDTWVWVPADDYLEPNCLEEKLKTHDGSVIYSCWNHVDENGNKIGEYHPPLKSFEQFRSLIWEKCEIGFTGIWIPKEIFQIVENFPINYVCSEDYAWMLKAANKNVDFKCVYKILYNKRLHNNRLTVKNSKQISSVVKQIREDMRVWK